MRIGCILLAAGSGKRFGGDKLLFSVDGIPMMEYALRLHQKIAYDARVVIHREGDTAVEQLAAGYHYLPVSNPRAAEGAGTSTACGIKALLKIGSFDGALFGVCDQPYLKDDTVRRMLAAFSETPHAIVTAAFENQRGNPVLFSRDYFAELAALEGEQGGRFVLKRHQECVRTVQAQSPLELKDIDCRDEALP